LNETHIGESGATPKDYDPRKIRLERLRLLYQWPLILNLEDHQAPTHKNIEKAIGQTRDAFDRCTNWTAADPATYLDEPTPLQKDAAKTAPPIPQSYQEYVYFHDFTQEFLYPRNGAQHQTFHLYENKTHDTLQASIYTGEKVGMYEFDIKRNTVHLFPFGVAIVTVELWLRSGWPLNLAQAQHIIDYLRRSDVPFFMPNGDGVLAGKVPLSVILDGQTTKIGQEQFEWAQTALKDGKRPAKQTLQHWKTFAGPLKSDTLNWMWRDPSDERIPCSSYILLEDAVPLQNELTLGISEGDWARLVEADDSGNRPFAYNPDFAKALTQSAAYERFKPHKDGVGDTLYLFGGAHFSAVGQGGEHAGMIAEHWRRHYAQLSLIVRFEMAALLSISSRLTKAVRLLEEADKSRKARDIFASTVLEIQEQFLLFVHRFRFTGVSAQIQATEMFEKWRESLALNELFRDIDEELKSATQMVQSWQQNRATERADRLNVLGFAAVIIGLVASVLGMNILVGSGDSEKLLSRLGYATEGAQVFFVTGLIFGFLALITLVYSFVSKRLSGFAGLFGLCSILCLGFLFAASHTDQIAELFGQSTQP
jgi:hypothetical protein